MFLLFLFIRLQKISLFGIINNKGSDYMQRYFINDLESFIDLSNNILIIKGDDAHHIINVMRMNIGEKIFACYNNKTYICSIQSLSKNEVSLNIEKEIIENKELPCNVTIAHGLVRKEKMEEVIDHITEMGASFYLPVVMKRSNVKLNEEKKDKKLIRLNKIAKEAAEQSHRTKVLEVLPTTTFKEFIKNSKDYDLKLVANVDLNNPLYIGDVIKDQTNILVLIGPESGIDDNELKQLKENNFLMVSLGKRVLRTEVAPSYVMSIIDYLRGNNHEI